MMPNNIQPLDYSKGGGKDGVLYKTDRDGNPNVFNLNRNDDGLWLNNNWTNPTNRWNANYEFVFSLRNSLHSLRIAGSFL